MRALLCLFFCLLCPAALAQQGLSLSANGLVQQMSFESPYWPTQYGFSNPVLMRANTGVSWWNLETSRGSVSTGIGTLFGPGTSSWTGQGALHGNQLLWTLFAPPVWATTAGSNSDASSNMAPYDVNTPAETCMAMGGDPSFTSLTGDCITLEFAEGFMQKNCNVSQTPVSPLVGVCSIHYVEGWNEFNATGYWGDTIANLAKVDADFDSIMKLYCGDCYMSAGSVSCGGDTNGNSCDTQEGQLLDAWYIYATATNKPLPDFVSLHMYPSRTTVLPVPMPETNISGDGSGLGNGTNGLGDSKCTSKNVPNIYCRYPVIQLPARFKALIAARPWMNPNTPLWSTESGFYGNANLVDTTNSYTNILRQAYVSRQAILLYNSGINISLWYQLNKWCFGTLYTAGKTTQPSGCPNDPVLPANTLLPAGVAMQVVTSWLTGSTVTVPCSGASATNAVWSCTLQQPSGTTVQLAWWTGWETSTNISTNYGHYQDINGVVHTIAIGTVPLTMTPIMLYP
jgi:hypothetical protein